MQENSEKINKKIQKMKKHNSDIISIQNGLREAMKAKKNLVLYSVQTWPGQENSEKNSKTIQKALSSNIFSQNGMK